MASDIREYDCEIINQVAVILAAIGPFSKETPRKDKWRTTEQLQSLLRTCFGKHVEVDELDCLLSDYEAIYRGRMNRGILPAAKIRRAVYPDRTTALPLWGSTEYHGQPWPEQPDAHRTDPPDDLPSALRVPADSPRVFLSHTHRDTEQAIHLAKALAKEGIGAWMYEVNIEARDNIAQCVRAAIKSTACCVALATRESIASLWVLTELHTTLENDGHVALVIDTTDDLLLDLLKSLKFHHPEQNFDDSVEYCTDTLERLLADYSSRATATRAARYPSQVKDFLASLPTYLNHLTEPAFTFPEIPVTWVGAIQMASIEQLVEKVSSYSNR